MGVDFIIYIKKIHIEGYKKFDSIDIEFIEKRIC